MKHHILTQFSQVNKLPFAEFYLNKTKNVLMVRYMKDVVIDLEKAKQVVNLVHPYIEEGAVYGMTDATASFLNITPEARALYKDNKSMQLSKAHAIVVKELYIRLIASLFIKFDRPIVPTRIFNDFHRAYKYLIDQADKVEELNSSKVPSE